jgi:hypothetical protein
MNTIKGCYTATNMDTIFPLNLQHTLDEHIELEYHTGT